MFCMSKFSTDNWQKKVLSEIIITSLFFKFSVKIAGKKGNILYCTTDVVCIGDLCAVIMTTFAQLQ